MDQRPLFALLKLDGDEFRGGVLPVDSLVEIQRYQRLVTQLAEAEWTRDHPDQPLPDDFHDDARLVIQQIGDGSADVFLALAQQSEYVVYQEQARDQFTEVLDAAYHDREIPSSIPLAPEVVTEFVSFGSTLAPGQSIVINPAAPEEERVTVTVENRERAVEKFQLLDFWAPDEQVEAPSQLTRPVEEVLAGRIVELDAENGTFRFDSLLHGPKKGWYRDPGMTADFKALLDVRSEAPVTRLVGDVQYKNGKLQRIWDTTSVERFELDNAPWSDRLAELAALRPGWGEHEASKSITFAALDAARDLLRALHEADAELPGVFPTESGGVVLEWSSPQAVRSVEALPDGGFELFDLPEGSDESTYQHTADYTAALAFVLGRR